MSELAAFWGAAMKRFSRSWREGRLWHWRHLVMAYLRVVLLWPHIFLIRCKCRINGRRLVVIALLEHCGDIIACEPVAREVRTLIPDAYLIWCVRSNYRELVDQNPSIDRVLILGCLTEWILLRKTRVFPQIFDLHARRRTCPTCWVPLEKSEGHPNIDINNYYEFGSLLQIAALSSGLGKIASQEPRVYISDSVSKKIDKLKLPDRFIVFHGKSNESSRDWLPEKWKELQELVSQKIGIASVEIGLSPVVPASATMHRNLCGQTGWLELAEVIRRATIFVGIDSGPAHMANAVGTPGVVLLGKYRSFSRYMPFSGQYSDGSNAELVYADGATNTIPVLSAYAALTLLMRRKSRFTIPAQARASNASLESFCS